MQRLRTVLLLNLLAILLSHNLYAVETSLTITNVNEVSPLLMPFENADNVNGNSLSNRTADIFLVLFLPSGAAGSAVVTLTAQNTSTEVPGFGVMTKADLVVSLNVGEEKLVGPFPTRSWNNSSGNVILSYSGTGASDVDVAALRATP